MAAGPKFKMAAGSLDTRIWLVVMFVHVAGVLSSPDPGIWHFDKITDYDTYKGVVKNMYSNTKMYIKVSCTGGPNVKLSVAWMLRKTPCWEEYLSTSADGLFYQQYFENPRSAMTEYYENAAPNYTVHFVKPDPQEFICDRPFHIQPFIDPVAEAEATQAQQVQAEETHKIRKRSAVGPPAEVPEQSHRPGDVSSVNSDSPQYVIRHDGVYLLVVHLKATVAESPIAMEEFMANIEVSFLSPTAGYLSLTDWPLLPFYGVMCGVYVVLGLLWFIFCSIHWRDILRLQFWIGGVIFLGMVEKAVFTSEYQNINSTGQATKGLIMTAEIVSCAKRTLARMLVIIVSLGYGIVKPRLGPTLNRVVATGLFYFILASVESVTRAIHPKNDPNNVPMLAAVPLAVIDASICWWVFSALIQTTRALRLRRNQVKLSVYKHFTNTLVFAVLSSIIFMVWSIKYHKAVECLTDWRDLWVDEAFWHLLFSVILLVIMVLWRPSQNNQRYAFTPLLDGEEDYSSDEDILYSDAWEGMKMRGKTTSRPQTPSGADPEEDPLGWVEENIAGMETALPALDSEEEIENTKLEISKLM